MRTYKVLKEGEIVRSPVPGRYAGNITHKIFGRLDCASGLRLMHARNRVFFLTWADAIAAGYRPCLKCRPSPHDRYHRGRRLHPQ
ncbi:MAG TPA: Ada metal-binding domain-containing protein [Candidatus Binatia bacterium]|jgi:methylphosphotriester-DNA--protein-cysteine methyltransferase|nr:Ada metal-binding domain-containing protein [Candidatus Binatia bacterium]